MIKFKQKGDFGNLDKYFKKSIEITKIDNIALVAERTLAQLKEATPKDSGLTANSWDYSITNNKNSKTLTFYNTNIQNGANWSNILNTPAIPSTTPVKILPPALNKPKIPFQTVVATFLIVFHAVEKIDTIVFTTV